MAAPLLTIQYLENSSALAQLDPQLAVDKLRAAAERLPITHLLIGWHLPVPLLEACRAEAQRLGIRFLRWQPLLTGVEEIRQCPDVQEMVIAHLSNWVHQSCTRDFSLTGSVFNLHRQNRSFIWHIFCGYCHRKAAEYDLDLVEIRKEIL